jgi:glycosyltransferase involved in cell wall biosynthesis
MQRVAERGPFDVIHAHSAVALACARFLPETPMVYTIHHHRDDRLSAFYQSYQDAHYVAISEDQRRREVALKNMTVIHHGLDPDKYQFSQRASGNYVCFVGRLAREKGPHTAIRAAAAAGVPICVAGEVHPPDRQWAATQLQHLLVERHVRALGGIGLAHKAPLLRDARALLAPIEWNEPFGLILIEAMLSGCPVVAFPHGSVPELVEEGVTGFVVESFRQLVDLIRPGSPLDRFDRVRCRERAVERFSRDRMVEQHLALYERVRRPALTNGSRDATGFDDGGSPALRIA